MKGLGMALVLGGLVIAGVSRGARAQGGEPVLQAAEDTQWVAGPAALPAGVQMAVLAGDPRRPGPYTLRLKLPSQYSIPAHSHPADEHVVVISGSLTFGMGDKLVKDAESNRTLAPGGFAQMPAGMHHFAYTGDDETTILLWGQGPLVVKYVDPANDPRSAPPKGTR